MTEALAFLLATFAACGDPAALAARPATPAILPARMRVAWDPETNTWSASSAPGAATLDRATSLGGPELPSDQPVEFALPGGGRAIALGRLGMEDVRVIRGKDGRFHAICEPAGQSTPDAPNPAHTDR